MALYHLVLSLKSIGDVWAITRIYIWTILVATKVAVFPPYPPWKWYSSADGQKLNMGSVGITAKIHQVCINIGIMTTLEVDYNYVPERLINAPIGREFYLNKEDGPTVCVV